MSRHTTFRTGGPASLFIRPENKDQLAEVMALIKKLEGRPNKELGKLADQIGSLCDKWDN